MSNKLLELRDDVQRLKDKAREHETMIVRLMEQVNLMQQQRKPGRPKKEPNGTI